MAPKDSSGHGSGSRRPHQDQSLYSSHHRSRAPAPSQHLQSLGRAPAAPNRNLPTAGSVYMAPPLDQRLQPHVQEVAAPNPYLRTAGSGYEPQPQGQPVQPYGYERATTVANPRTSGSYHGYESSTCDSYTGSTGHGAEYTPQSQYPQGSGYGHPPPGYVPNPTYTEPTSGFLDSDEVIAARESRRIEDVEARLGARYQSTSVSRVPSQPAPAGGMLNRTPKPPHKHRKGINIRDILNESPPPSEHAASEDVSARYRKRHASRGPSGSSGRSKSPERGSTPARPDPGFEIPPNIQQEAEEVHENRLTWDQIRMAQKHPKQREKEDREREKKAQKAKKREAEAEQRKQERLKYHARPEVRAKALEMSRARYREEKESKDIKQKDALERFNAAHKQPRVEERDELVRLIPFEEYDRSRDRNYKRERERSSRRKLDDKKRVEKERQKESQGQGREGEREDSEEERGFERGQDRRRRDDRSQDRDRHSKGRQEKKRGRGRRG